MKGVVIVAYNTFRKSCSHLFLPQSPVQRAAARMLMMLKNWKRFSKMHHFQLQYPQKWGKKIYTSQQSQWLTALGFACNHDIPIRYTIYILYVCNCYHKAPRSCCFPAYFYPYHFITNSFFVGMQHVCSLYSPICSLNTQPMDLNLRAIIYAKYRYVVKERITSHRSIK